MNWPTLQISDFASGIIVGIFLCSCLWSVEVDMINDPFTLGFVVGLMVAGASMTLRAAFKLIYNVIRERKK